MKEKITYTLTTIVFAALIFGFAIVNVIKPDQGFSEGENRFLAQKPSFSLEKLFNGSYTAAVEEYITDQFIGRDEFIGVKTQSEYLIGKKDSSSVYFGNDGYLIEKHDASNVDEFQLKKNMDRLSQFINTQAKQLGEDRVAAMLVPTADEILKDKLPQYAPSYNQTAVFDRFRESVPNSTYIDVASVLREHADEYIYYKTDHHWTTDGAYYAYRAYCDQLGIQGLMREDFDITTVTNDFFGTIYSKAHLQSTKPDSINRYLPKLNASYRVDFNMGEKQADSLYVDSFLQKRDKYSYFLGGNNAVVEITSENKNGKTLLLIKDSFAHSIAPFLANDYETIFMVDLRYYNGKMTAFIEENSVTDLLVLYNFATLSSDNSILKIDK